MADVYIAILVAIMKFILLTYNILTYPLWLFIKSPFETRRISRRLKAKPVEEGDFSSPYRTVDSFETLTTTLFEECNTLDDLFARAVRLHGDNNCLGKRELLSEEDEKQPNGKVFKKLILGNYTWQTFEEINTRLTNLGSGLLALGQQPRKNICIFAETKPEWMISMQACLKYNFPVVTLYATLGEEAIIHGINESEVTHVITSSDLLGKFKNILDQMPRVTHLIYIEDNKKPKLDGFPSNVQLHSMSSVEQKGASPENIKTPVTKPQRQDLALIMYTSGSTGLPKGVLITHNNLMCGMSGQCQRIPKLGPSDVYIGYLPLAHVLELSAELACLSHGAKIGYSTPLTLSDQSSKIKRGSKGDASVLKPTLMAAVPVIMDRLYKAVWEKVRGGGPLATALFTVAYEYKSRRLSRGYDTLIFNRTVFKKTRKLLGGKVRMMLCGGAPLSAETQRFMNICMCCSVGQGYGLTETCGAGTIAEVTDLSLGRVGAPLQCNEIKLVAWPEGGYTTNDKPNPRGEIVIGGGNVTQGYYKNPDKTEEDFANIDGQRWFYTGDIGEFEEDGCLKIIDRKKDLVKLQAGEYVSLAKVEVALKMAPIADNICVYADSSKMYTIGFVVPNVKQLMALAKEKGLETDNWKDLCGKKEMETEVQKILQQQGLKCKLERFEIPQKIKLCTEIWSPDMGLVTDAFKLKRKSIQAHYQSDINRMYA